MTWIRVSRSLLLTPIIAVIALGCEGDSPAAPPPNERETTAVTFSEGSLSREEILQEATRLPPALRDQFDRGPVGREEFARSLVDKRLLVAEARRQGFADDPDIRRQVLREEERLIVRELLASEEKAVGKASEEEIRAYFDANQEILRIPEKVRLARVLVARAGESRTNAAARAEMFRRRLLEGEPTASVAKEGDGPEHLRGGDLGLREVGSFAPEIASVLATLSEHGAVSPVLEMDGGLAVLVLVERRPSYLPSIEESRAEVENRLGPMKKRQVFEQLLSRLRKDAAIEVDLEALK